MSRWRILFAYVLPLVGCFVIVCAVVGCSNQPGAMPNPFAQTGRVPAPATRVPTPGTAVPSYGSWPQAPVGSSPPPPTGGMFGTNSIPLTTTLASTGVGSVGIPRDDQSLRFELPPPALEQPIVELAARDLPRNVNLGQPATFVPPANTQPVAAPRVRLPGGMNMDRENVVPSDYQLAGQIRQRPAIMEIPDPTRSVAPVVDQTADGFRPRGAARDTLRATVPSTPSEFSQPAIGNSRAGYGYGPAYQQLRGRIEFSPAIGYWKLRYIPVDGATDEFGGSVIIANPDALTGFQAGDWAIVEGQLQASPSPTGSYTGLFTITSIARQ